MLPPNLFWKYPLAAQKYIDGTLATKRLVDFSPLYLYLHVFTQTYFDNATTATLWIHIILIAVSSVFLFDLLRKYCRMWISLVGVLLFITNHSIIIYTGTFEPEPLVIFFILGFLVFARYTSPLPALGAGLFLSLSLLTRSTFFPLILITPVVYRYMEKDRKRWLRSSALFLMPIALAVSFLIARNTAATGRITLFSMNPGHVFFEGNNPISTGESGVYPPMIYDSREDFPAGSDYRHELYRIFAQRILKKSISIAESNGYWMEKAKRYILDHPANYLSLLITKLNFFFHGFKRHDIWYLHVKEQHIASVLPTIPFAWITAMALVGLIISLRYLKEDLFILAVFFIQFGTMMLTYVSERQRVGIIAVIIFIALRMIEIVITNRKYAIATVSVVVFAMIFSMQNDLIQEHIHVSKATLRSDEMFRRSIDYRLKKEPARAAKANVLAYAAAPWREDNIRLSGIPFAPESFHEQALNTALSIEETTHSARFDKAILYLENRRLDDAETILRELNQTGYRFNRRYTQSALPDYYLAVISVWRRNSEQAESYLKSALNKNPGDPWVLSLLSAMTGRKIYEERLFRYFDPIDADFFIGRACLTVGRNERAVQHFSNVVNLLPEFRKGFIYHSLALGAAGRYEQAAKSYLTAMKMRSDPIFREKDIISIFVNWVIENPQDADAKAYLSRVLKDFGFGSYLIAVK